MPARRPEKGRRAGLPHRHEGQKNVFKEEKMLECQSCGARFAQPRRRRESRGCCFGLPAWEWLDACPRCGGAYIELPDRTGGGDGHDR